MSGHYFDRRVDGVTLCEPCGDGRWGEDDQGFRNRCEDTSGDWCWTFWLAGDVACDTCGRAVH